MMHHSETCEKSKEKILLFGTAEGYLNDLEQVEMLMYQIFKKEIGMLYKNKKIYTPHYRYPLSVVLFVNREKAGFFDPEKYQIGIHRSLLHKEETLLKDVLRHEIAHFLTFVEFGSLVKPHGAEFRQICNRYHWNENVMQATLSVSFPALTSSKKMQKLRAMTKSSNIHEAKIALQKLENLSLDSEESDASDFSLIELGCVKRGVQKWESMARYLMLLETLPIINHTEKGFILEVFGPAKKIEIATYSFEVIERAIQSEQIRLKKAGKLKGLSESIAFYSGFIEGLTSELHKKKSKSQNLKESTRALTVTQESLHRQMSRFFPNLRFRNRSQKALKMPYKIGKDLGKEFEMPEGISSRQPPIKKLSLYESNNCLS